jgi:hypothetical protein
VDGLGASWTQCWLNIFSSAVSGKFCSYSRVTPTSTHGALNGPQLFGHVRPARGPNGQTLEVVARLIRADVADNLLLLQVFPSQNTTSPFKLSVRATTDVLRRVDPSWPALRLTGSLISDLLVADHVEQAYAPIPERWTDWVRGRPPKLRTRTEGTEAAPRSPVTTAAG